MKLVIITGMSGAGKTVALKMLEDRGYYCVDNLPIPLMKKFTELLVKSPDTYDRVALGIDVRSGKELPELEHVLGEWTTAELNYQMLFFDSSDPILIKRYKESRRSHPLESFGRITDGIEKERKLLKFLKEKADFILDTSQLLTRELRYELERIVIKEEGFKNLMVSVLSFGFKHGIPVDADLVFDVRFLPNPYYEEDLKKETGENINVRNFVKQDGVADEFCEKLNDMMEFLIPKYVQEGKNQLVIGIGCTGGKHRSVTIAKELHAKLVNNQAIGVRIEHRDIEK